MENKQQPVCSATKCKRTTDKLGTCCAQCRAIRRRSYRRRAAKKIMFTDEQVANTPTQSTDAAYHPLSKKEIYNRLCASGDFTLAELKSMKAMYS